jgi:solute:Na+ symporter, SSS family
VNHLNSLDYSIIACYFACLVGLALYLQKKASASIEDYFLGGRTLPWWALGISGMASFLDIAGTMLIVSFLFIMGPRGLFIEFRGGAVLVLAVMMLWTGKWSRRSQVVTGAEWMTYRFGEGFGGQFARIVAALVTILGTVSMLAYMVKGIGLFLSMFVPLPPMYCALIMIGIATLYTMVSGFYGVVYTDIFQSGIIMIAVVSISVMAIVKIGTVPDFSALAVEVSGNSQWMSSACQWRTEMPKGYEQYSWLMLFAVFYIFRNVVCAMGSGAEPKYLGAQSDKDCGRLTFLWTWLMAFRWPMMIAFAVLGIFLVKELFPDQAVLATAADMIKTSFGGVEKSRWPAVLADVMNNADKYPALAAGLRETLGESWQTNLHLVSFEGTVNPEKILPAVILFNIPMGFRGLILVALIAASMSTFDSTVNFTAGFFTRDLYQRYLRPKASTRELMFATWMFCIVLVAGGFWFGSTVESVTEIWGWIIMILGGGLLMPSVLKFYWWRFNGGGFAIGSIVGSIAAVSMKIMGDRGTIPEFNEAQGFGLAVLIGLVATIAGTYMTKPTERAVLEKFYKETRPFGFWGPLHTIIPPNMRRKMDRENRRDVLALPFALMWQITLFLLPMQMVLGAWRAFGITFAIFAVSLSGLYFIWLRHIGEDDQTVDEALQA